ncbi:hypothetical protein BGZ46_001505 [Entomortierella lignicola]|nr:hypothetical protein BGZ46_001505 [Entomortierella lignicola]
MNSSLHGSFLPLISSNTLLPLENVSTKITESKDLPSSNPTQLVEEASTSSQSSQQSGGPHHSTKPVTSTISDPEILFPTSINLNSSYSDPPAYYELQSSQNNKTFPRVTTPTLPTRSTALEPTSVLQEEDNHGENVSPQRIASASTSVPAPVYRQLLGEDDELPEYIPIAENNLTFKLLASQSTTYTIIPSQGPSEFREQGSRSQNNRQGTSSQPNNIVTSELGATHQYANVLEVIQGSRNDDLDEHNLRRPGSWTLEYWVNDTIAYLCYLMDPNLSTATGFASPEPIIEPNQPDVSFIHQRGSIELGTIDSPQLQRSIEFQSPELDGLERVHIGHIRGRPPPLNRTRHTVTVSFLGNQGATPTLAPIAPSPDASTSVVPTVDAAIPNSPTAGHGSTAIYELSAVTGRTNISLANSATVSSTSAPSSSSPLPPTLPTTTLNISILNSSESGAGQSTIAEDIAEDSVYPGSPPRLAVVGTLPSVRHIQINDGYQGEEVDTILAHAVDIQGSQNDTVVNLGNSAEFNNVLSTEFLKSPTFAFVSAEDPQTWIWWSTQHDSNLQKCRMENSTDVVTMWWRLRADLNSKESRQRRRRDKIMRNQLKAGSKEKLGLQARWRRFLSLDSSGSHRQDMEIFMRVRGVHYAWREEDYESREGTSSNLLTLQNSLRSLSAEEAESYFGKIRPRVFSLVRDDSFVMGRMVKGGTVAEVWIEGATEVQTSPIGSEVLPSNQSNLESSVTPGIQVRSLSLANISVHSSNTGSSSPFPAELRRRRCVIRIAHGLHTEVETFALSTGPRLVEFFKLYTDQSVPGPSRSSFYCAVTTFAVLFLVVFVGTAYFRRQQS